MFVTASNYLSMGCNTVWSSA